MIWIVIWAVIAGVIGDRRDFHFAGIDSSGVSFLGQDYEYDIPPVGAPQVSYQGVARVVLDNLRGNLSLRGVDTADIKVSGRKTVRAFSHSAADRANQQTRVMVEREGDAIVIRSSEPERSGTLQITTDLDISVPKGFAVESRGRSGDLSIDDVDGAVAITAGRGDVHLARIGRDVRIDGSRGGLVHAEVIQGNLDLEGRGGDVQLSNIAGEVTINGEYSGTLEFRALAKPLRFESSRTEFHVAAVPRPQSRSILANCGLVSTSQRALSAFRLATFQRHPPGDRRHQCSPISPSSAEDIQVTDGKTPLPKMEIRSRNRRYRARRA